MVVYYDCGIVDGFMLACHFDQLARHWHAAVGWHVIGMPFRSVGTSWHAILISLRAVGMPLLRIGTSLACHFDRLARHWHAISIGWHTIGMPF